MTVLLVTALNPIEAAMAGDACMMVYCSAQTAELHAMMRLLPASPALG